jgi:hypothetical protein
MVILVYHGVHYLPSWHHHLLFGDLHLAHVVFEGCLRILHGIAHTFD